MVRNEEEGLRWMLAGGRAVACCSPSHHQRERLWWWYEETYEVKLRVFLSAKVSSRAPAELVSVVGNEAACTEGAAEERTGKETRPY